jgi:hypothetical protein
MHSPASRPAPVRTRPLYRAPREMAGNADFAIVGREAQVQAVAAKLLTLNTGRCVVKVYSYSGEYAGEIRDDGAIISASGDRLGEVDSRGNVRNKNNAPAGQIKDWGDVYGLVGESGAVLAWVDRKRTIYRQWPNEEGGGYEIGRVEALGPIWQIGAGALLVVRTDIFHPGGPQAPKRITPMGERGDDRY